MAGETKLYWFAMSHPSMAARRMLDIKRVPYRVVDVMPGMQRPVLRLAGFRGGTVPALKLEGRRIQGSREIARALEQLRPDPPLFPAGAEERRRAEDAERWGEQVLQNAPRVLIRWGLTGDMALRTWMAGESGMPLPAVSARTLGPVARYYARLVGADEQRAQATVAELPAMLDRADGLLADGTLDVRAPGAATLQVLSSVRALDSLTDLRALLDGHPSVAAARELFPQFPGPVPAFLPAAWLELPLAGAHRA